VDGTGPVLSGIGAAATPKLATASVPRAQVRPLSPARYSLHVTISQETHDKLRRAQDLLGRARPADPAEVLDRALTLLVAQLERKKAGAPPRPTKAARPPSAATTADVADTTPPRVAKRASDGPASGATTRRRRSRHIPAAVRRAVWERDGARCAYVSPGGVRCGATSRLEFHHRIPFADGGPATVDNVALACRLHNRVEAERWFNSDWTELKGRSGLKRGSP
jgi:5-methylcytosine-specific restriction endonuclease McrA